MLEPLTIHHLTHGHTCTDCPVDSQLFFRQSNWSLVMVGNLQVHCFLKWPHLQRERLRPEWQSGPLTQFATDIPTLPIQVVCIPRNHCLCFFQDSTANKTGPWERIPSIPTLKRRRQVDQKFMVTLIYREFETCLGCMKTYFRTKRNKT